jgi:hypothetical protein
MSAPAVLHPVLSGIQAAFGCDIEIRGEPPARLPRLVRNYFASCASTSGSTDVPSNRTASGFLGSSPSAFRIVGATCVVAVAFETVCALKPG